MDEQKMPSQTVIAQCPLEVRNYILSLQSKLALIAEDRAGLVEALKEASQLLDKAIELAEHGDYSNGNTDGVIDEGCVLALGILNEIKAKKVKIDAAIEGRGNQ